MTAGRDAGRVQTDTFLGREHHEERICASRRSPRASPCSALAAHAQSGVLNKAVGGYTFEDAAKEAPDTKNFNSKDGKLTFAIVTHTAGNGFFDPTYVGAQVAANAFGINLIMLGSEAPVDDIPREIAILNQIVQDPTIDGVIMTTPQSGAYDDIVKKLTEQRHPGRHDQLVRPQAPQPLRHLAHRPGRLGGRRSAARRWSHA